jgi:hypothetical protein
MLSHHSTTLVGLGHLYEVPRSHQLDTLHLLELWTRDQPVAETSTRHHTTLTRDYSRIRTSNHSKRAAVDPRLKLCGHWSREFY